MPNSNFVMSCLMLGGKYGPKKTCSLIFNNLGLHKILGPLAPFQGELCHFGKLLYYVKIFGLKF